MPINRLMALLIATTVVMPTLGQAAYADLLIKVDKTTQRMTVTVNGNQLYDWPVSTGGGGYDTPNGTFKPFRMDIDHTVRHRTTEVALFIGAVHRVAGLYVGNRDTYFRIHGTNEPATIGSAVSSGCIRLFNQDIIDLYNRVPPGTPVVVL